MTERMRELKGEKLLQATQMRDRARDNLKNIGEALGANGCTRDGSSCADTGYGSVSDTPNCG